MTRANTSPRAEQARAASAAVAPPPPSVRLDPAPAAWRSAAHAWRGWEREDCARVRAALGLPTGGPIVMTGHQATFWHAGILAKYLAATHTAQALGGSAAYVVVDQDEAEFASLRVPVTGESGELRAAEVAFTAPPPEGATAWGLPPFDPASGNDPAFALPSVALGVARVRDALRAHNSAPTAAAQVSRAAMQMLAEVLPPSPLVFATDLAALLDFVALVERLRSEAPKAAALYNDAARANPKARLSTLAIDASRGRTELPLWKLEKGLPRTRAWSDTQADAAGAIQAPRALLMTAFLRRYACDLFIHGTGGGVYDVATESWLRAWLGWELAPTVIATADLLLPLAGPEVSEDDITASSWLAHHARHDPALLGRGDVAEQKAAIVRAVREARQRGDDALPPYRDLQRLLERYREEERTRLAELRDRADALAAARGPLRLARDRTWAFPLHEPSRLAELRAAVSRALAGL